MKALAIAPLAFLAVTGSLLGQALVEHAVTSGAAATATAPLTQIGKKIGAAVGNTGKTLDKAKPQITTPGAAPKGAPVTESASAEPLKPAVTYEDPAGIQVGMGYSEVIRRFGRPGTMITGEDGAETLWYTGNAPGGELRVIVRDNKVVSLAARRTT
ncbi:MAG TPA: hypothetical protein VKR61_08115 [Bryobacteraceae bacterium]|nr:hypothetical protein [Bryobacteraceae bacterium]